MNLLGISAYYHDAAAALLCGGRIEAAAQEERFTRKKFDPGFPAHAVRFCLRQSGLSLNELDGVVFYDKPLLKFERLLETYYAFAPRGLRSFLTAMPVWIKEKMLLKKLLREELQKIEPVDFKKVKLLFPEHHLSHAASAFFPSPYDEAAVLTIDGVGEWATTTLGLGKGNKLTILKELRFPHSLGLLYSAFTYYLGFSVNSGEYKVMGLAPYGDPESGETKKFVETIKKEIVDLKPDGSLWLNQDYFDYAAGLKMVREGAWEKCFGFPRRKPESELTQTHGNFALALQQVTEEAVLNLAREAKKLTGARRLCLAGGVALNCVANGKLWKSGLFDGIFVQPAAGDAGGALGGALAAAHLYFDEPRTGSGGGADAMQGAYLGPRFSNLDVELTAKKFKAVTRRFDGAEALARQTAAWIAEGAVVGWFQGRMEFGPRALGARSILADARNREMQKKLNLKIKFRETFRPFAPVVPAEAVAEYFEWTGPSPYMLFTADVVKNRRNPLPQGYAKLPLRDRLMFQRSDIPSVTHLDYSARLQTVHRETNPRFHELLTAFKEKTGCAVLVNTSFNVRGEPIVCSPEDAYRCFMRTDMDYLVMEDYAFAKAEQPHAGDKERWKEKFEAD